MDDSKHTPDFICAWCEVDRQNVEIRREREALCPSDNDTQAELAAWEMLADARRQRDVARELCRWAFPRLRAMCHDFDATSTGWECAEHMLSHPDIFCENAQVEARREDSPSAH